MSSHATFSHVNEGSSQAIDTCDVTAPVLAKRGPGRPKGTLKATLPANDNNLCTTTASDEGKFYNVGFRKKVKTIRWHRPPPPPKDTGLEITLHTFFTWGLPKISCTFNEFKYAISDQIPVRHSRRIQDQKKASQTQSQSESKVKFNTITHILFQPL